MARVLVTINTEQRPLPAGVTFAGYSFRCALASGELVKVLQATEPAATFDGLPDDLLAFECSAIDAAGQPIGAPVSAELDLRADAGGPDFYAAPVGLSFLVG